MNRCKYIRYYNREMEELTIGSCELACVYIVMDARGKFGEHDRSVRVAPRATLASRVLSKFPKCIHNSIYTS